MRILLCFVYLIFCYYCCCVCCWLPVHLEALAVDDGRARLVVLLLGDPHLLEGREGGEDGAADPDGVLALRGGDNLDLHGRRGERGDLLREAVRDAVEHGGAAREDDPM